MGQKSDGRQTVMVVDDTEDLRQLIAMQLRMSGYGVIEAKDGLEAVELARENCPALILMDIHMPVMDGLAATRLLRQIEELCGTAIVAFSAFGSGDNHQRALDAGCNAYVNKTDYIGDLSGIVRRFLPAA